MTLAQTERLRQLKQKKKLKDEFSMDLEPGLCLFAFFPYQPQQGQSDFNFGLPFTRQYCTTFDIGKKQIGFAEAYPDGPRTTSTQKPTTSTLKPTTSTQKPTTSTQKPTTSTQQK
ncbi:hypothetical protein ANCDUO_12244 [Ancylostoma duodenale]|uniref:Peptidase A1 domain-containing protein n=1 Tax=Ancylostoma duodenale TaxID=51022 RepID=A0A0C2D620_9BILA|nr:hypothetical protein ANCDUO_12244 [Ancylostoma duodenale]